MELNNVEWTMNIPHGMVFFVFLVAIFWYISPVNYYCDYYKNNSNQKYKEHHTMRNIHRPFNISNFSSDEFRLICEVMNKGGDIIITNPDEVKGCVNDVTVIQSKISEKLLHDRK